MDIELKKVSVRDLTQGYIDNQTEGVRGFNGKLDIRPAYQREFIYEPKEKKAVINTVVKGFPLNSMYWANNEDGSFELLDGQQRTLSICEFVINHLSVEFKKGTPQQFNNLNSDEQEQILNYELMIYICTGNKTDKLNWFETINIAGKPLTPQELKNALYTGEWLSDAKVLFSKLNCKAYNIAKAGKEEKYLKGKVNRQEYLETALSWISGDKTKITDYMSKHQNDDDATELWIHFEKVINWIKAYFPIYRKDMTKVNWGALYNQYKDTKLNKDTLENQIKQLMQDEEIGRKEGIYDYVLTGNQNKLSIRAFDANCKREAYERQNGICVTCSKDDKEKLKIYNMEADHIIPWSQGGKTIPSNCQMLCKSCNRIKSNK